MTEDLFTPNDVKRVREYLLKEQGGNCAILKAPIPKGRTACLDHNHFADDQFVRGVIERELNAFVGVSENAHRRFLRYWLPTPLPDVLRLVADYLEASERNPDKRWRHPMYKKKLQTKFNALTTKGRNLVLEYLGYSASCSNDTARKKAFEKLLKDRSLGYEIILGAIEKVKTNV